MWQPYFSRLEKRGRKDSNGLLGCSDFPLSRNATFSNFRNHVFVDTFGLMQFWLMPDAAWEPSVKNFSLRKVSE